MSRHALKIFVALIFVGSANANVVSTGNQNFNPTPDGLDFLTVHSSETLKPGIINLGLFLNNAINSLPYFESSNQDRTTFNDSLLGLDLNIGVGITENFEMGLSHPFVLAQSVSSNQTHSEFDAKGGTEVRVLGKYRFSGNDRGGWAGIFSTNFNRIINNPYIGRDGGLIHNLELAWDTTINQTAWGINVGYRKTNPGSPLVGMPVEPMGDQVIASTAVSHHLPKYDLKLISEIFGSWPAQKKNSNPDRVSSSLELIAGVKYDLSTKIALHAGGGTELQHGVASPDWRVYGGLNYVFGPVFSKTSSFFSSTDKPRRFRLENLNFEFDSDILSEASEKSLSEVAEKIRELGFFKELIIEGHTDSLGSESYNKILSQKRAHVMRNYLIKKGFAGDNIKAVGYGELQPIADNGNFQGREQNRRVEFEVFK